MKALNKPNPVHNLCRGGSAAWLACVQEECYEHPFMCSAQSCECQSSHSRHSQQKVSSGLIDKARELPSRMAANLKERTEVTNGILDSMEARIKKYRKWYNSISQEISIGKHTSLTHKLLNASREESKRLTGNAMGCLLQEYQKGPFRMSLDKIRRKADKLLHKFQGIMSSMESIWDMDIPTRIPSPDNSYIREVPKEPCWFDNMAQRSFSSHEDNDSNDEIKGQQGQPERCTSLQHEIQLDQFQQFERSLEQYDNYIDAYRLTPNFIGIGKEDWGECEEKEQDTHQQINNVEYIDKASIALNESLQYLSLLNSYNGVHSPERITQNPLSERANYRPINIEVSDIIGNIRSVSDYTDRDAQPATIIFMNCLEEDFPLIEQRLQDADDIRSLELINSPFGDQLCQTITILHNMTILHFDGCNLTDIGMGWISQLLHLKELYVNNNPLISEQGFKAALSLGELVLLEMPLPEITRLDLHHMRVEDRGAAFIAQNLPNLMWLWIRDNGLTDNGAASLSCIRSLTWLRIDRNSIGAKGIVEIANSLSNLSWLYIDGTLPADSQQILWKRLPKTIISIC